MEPTKRGWGWWEIATCCVLGTLLVGAVVMWALPETRKTPVAAGPLAVAAFADGAELRIYGVSTGTRTVDYPVERPVWKRFVTSRGSEGRNNGDLDLQTKTENGRIVQRSARRPGQQPFFIEFELTDAAGRPRVLVKRKSPQGDVSAEDSSGGVVVAGTRLPAAGDLAELQAAMKSTGLELLVQHRDPETGWVGLDGPYLFDAAGGPRRLAVLGAWRRDLADLDFRAIRDDGGVVEFSLANPDVRPTPAALAPAPLPQTHSGPDLALTLRSAERFPQPGSHPFIAVDLELESGGKTMTGELGEPVALGAVTLTDEWGNAFDARHEEIAGEVRFGARVPAHSANIMAAVMVNRTVNMPRGSAGGLTVLEGEVSPDGTEMRFTAGADAARMGIAPPAPVVFGAGQPGFARTHPGWKSLRIELAGGGSNEHRAELESRFGPVFQWQIAVFPEGSHESAGVMTTDGIGNTSSSSSGFRFKRVVDWTAPPELLPPGGKVRILILPPLAPDRAVFHFALPPIR